MKCVFCLVGQQSSPTGSEARNSGYHRNWNLGNERQQVYTGTFTPVWRRGAR